MVLNRLLAIFLVLPFLTHAGFSPIHLPCQLQKPKGVSPLVGCQPGTLYVSPTDAKAGFKSVMQAVQSLPNDGPATILIGEGDYHETVNITRRGPVTLLGQVNSSILEKPTFETTVTATRNLVQIWDNKFVTAPPPAQDDAQTAVLIISPSFSASLIGSGPTGAPLQPLLGSSDFKAYNIDFANRAANFSISQALVTDISYANASFYGCTFAGWQDTWYTGRNASTFVRDSVVFGQTDYLFGFGTAWFENVTLANRACGGGIAAWKGTNLTDAPNNHYGAYISNSRIIRSPDANATTVTSEKCFLGRPWNDLATTVYLNTFMDESIAPVGFIPFDSARPVIMNTTFYAEFGSSGPGGNTSSRVPIEHILTTDEAAKFTLENVFGGRPEWIDFEYFDIN